MQGWRKPRALSRVVDIAGLPQHLIRYHVERGHIPIRHRANCVHYYSDAEIRMICDYFGVPCPEELECVATQKEGAGHAKSNGVRATESRL
jgi:hypothetical protein